MNGKLRKAIDLLAFGHPVFIHDFSGREDEVDMVYLASKIDYRSILNLRKYAGGLICYVTTKKVGDYLGLKYMSDILKSAGYKEIAGRPLGYGDPPNFSLWVNHMNVKTGIRDKDRALTIRELDRVVDLILKNNLEEGRRKFYSEFVSPGHVPILLGRGLDKRKGHTELSLALLELGNLPPSAVIAEVLNEGGAMKVEEVLSLAKEFNTVVIEASEIVEKWFAYRK